jgi:hypothetical protein
MEMMKIDNIWNTLELDNNNNSGLLYKRYSAEVLPDIFVALKLPERLRCLAIRITATFPFIEHQWNKFKDIKIEAISDERDKDKKFLLIILLNKQHKDVFSTLCQDLIFNVSELTNEQSLIEKLLERLAKWQSLFEKIGKYGLSDESQRGLYGEVYFLRLFLNSATDKYYCIKSWHGPENAIQDFQHSNWAVEVKTTHGNNHQKIHISSERQLDDSILEKIFLFHLSLDIRAGNGETLNNLIDAVFETLSNNTLAMNLFQLKLFEYGYFEAHRPYYNDKGFTIRQENIYRVRGSFPRIVESQIPVGVGDVKYSIVLSESEEWRIDHQTLFDEIKAN